MSSELIAQHLCAFAVATIRDVAERFDTTNAALAEGLVSTVVTPGLAGMRADDTLESLIGRADDDRYRRLR